MSHPFLNFREFEKRCEPEAQELVSALTNPLHQEWGIYCELGMLTLDAYNKLIGVRFSVGEEGFRVYGSQLKWKVK